MPKSDFHLQFVVKPPSGRKNYGGKARSKRYVFRFFRKEAGEVSERSDKGRLFQRTGAHELNAREPVTVLVLGTVSSGPWFDLRRRLGVALTKTSRR